MFDQIINLLDIKIIKNQILSLLNKSFSIDSKFVILLPDIIS